MSPVSRGRKSKKRNTPARRPAPVRLTAAPDPPVEVSELVDGFFADLADDAMPAGPLAAEYGAALLVAMCEIAGEAYEKALAEGFVPEFEARANTAALTMLLALGSVCDGRAGKAAADAASRMVDSGVGPPGWGTELGEPVTARDCWRLADLDGGAAMLICSFDRAGSDHAFVVTVDHNDCGAAVHIELFDAAGLPQAMERVRQSGVVVSEERLDPAELRWQVECALEARAVHDDELDERPFDEDGMPDYYPLAVLLRARMRALPDSGKPKPPHDAPPVPVPRRT